MDTIKETVIIGTNSVNHLYARRVSVTVRPAMKKVTVLRVLPVNLDLRLISMVMHVMNVIAHVKLVQLGMEALTPLVLIV